MQTKIQHVSADNASPDNVREITANLLKVLHISATELAHNVGMSYMRVFNLMRGRTKKYNRDVVELIVARYPEINPIYLFTGTGEVKVEAPKDEKAEPQPHVSMYGDVQRSYERMLDLSYRLDEKIEKLSNKEQELNKRELEIQKRELELTYFIKRNNLHLEFPTQTDLLSQHQTLNS